MGLMRGPFCIYTATKYLLFIFILIFLSGCLFIPFPIEEQFETPIKKINLQKIERGKTTRLEIIEWLGPPDAIAREGKTMKVPPLGPSKEGSLDVNSQDFLDLFSEKHVIIPKHIVYYYETSAFHGTGAVIVLLDAGGVAPITPLRLMVSRLWILVDTETGHVVDYIFHEEREKFSKKREKLRKKGVRKEDIDVFEEDY